MSTQQHRGRGRTTLATLVAAALLTSGAAAAAPGAATADSVKPLKSVSHSAKGGGKDKLGAADRTKLAKAEGAGDKTVTAMIMTKPSSTKRLARAIEAAGGYVRMTDAGLGYVSALVPTSKLDKVVVSDSDVQAVDLDEVVKLPKDTVTTNGAATGTYSGPSASTPDSNPYMPTKDTGSTAFKAQHKAWDGRGVTIGILDSGIDLDSAPLRTTTTPGEEKVDRLVHRHRPGHRGRLHHRW